VLPVTRQRLASARVVVPVLKYNAEKKKRRPQKSQKDYHRQKGDRVETRYPITPATLAGVKSEREDRSTRIGARCLVGASRLDVARLLQMCQHDALQRLRSSLPYLAAVADALVGGLLGAVAADVTDLTTVVALLTLGAVAGHVSETAAENSLADMYYRSQCAKRTRCSRSDRPAGADHRSHHRSHPAAGRIHRPGCSSWRCDRPCRTCSCTEPSVLVTTPTALVR